MDGAGDGTGLAEPTFAPLLRREAYVAGVAGAPDCHGVNPGSCRYVQVASASPGLGAAEQQAGGPDRPRHAAQRVERRLLVPRHQVALVWGTRLPGVTVQHHDAHVVASSLVPLVLRRRPLLVDDVHRRH